MSNSSPASSPGTLVDIARKVASGAPMQTLEAASVTEAAGIQGDYRGNSTRRQVTVLTKEAWDEACAEVGNELSWTNRRANLFVEGVTLAETVGKKIHVGSLVLLVTGETKPCELMEATQTGLRESLASGWRGGVTCKVIQGGDIRIGDPVSLES